MPPHVCCAQHAKGFGRTIGTSAMSGSTMQLRTRSRASHKHRTVTGHGSSNGARSVGGRSCTAAKERAKLIEEIAAGLGRSLRDMAEPEEAVDQPDVRYVLHLDTHLA